MDPLLGSVDAALDWSKIEPILDRYRGMTDLFLLIVDRDGNPHRSQALQGLEDKARLLGGCALLGENAWQEVEVWALAGQQNLPAKWRWNEIRSDRHPKETYFERWVQERSLEDSPGGGRLTLGKEAAHRYPRLKQLCPEDVASLEERLRVHVGTA